MVLLENKALYEFTVELFNSSTDEILFLDSNKDDLDNSINTVKNWFRSGKRNQSYMKYLHIDNFNAVKFNTFLKARTMGSWRKLLSSFRTANVENPECLIDFVTDNHDKFLESVEWQFKAILRIPIVVDSDIDHLTLAINSDDGKVIPKLGYNFYFTDEQDICRGYMYNKFHEMKSYKAFRINEDEAGEILAKLKYFLP